MPERSLLTFGPHGPVSNFELLGRLNYSSAHKGLLPHVHADVMEICYLSKGRQTYEVNGRRHTLTGGDVFITYPGEPHGTGNLPEEKSVLYWIWINLKKTPAAFLGCAPGQGKGLRAALTGLKKRHFSAGQGMARLLDGIFLLEEDPMPFSALLIRNRITEFLVRMIEAGKNAPSPVSGRIRTVADHIDGHITERLPLPALAGMAGLSLSRFKQRFRMEMGIPPGEYILRKKIGRAESMLKETDETVTEIAYDLDFSSSQYFATVFKRITGKKPMEYRRK